jgi:hypothetical protein
MLTTTSSIQSRGSVRPLESYRPPVVQSGETVRQLLEEYPLTGEGRYGCYFISDSSPYSDIARAVECEVFQEFFGNMPSLMVEEYAAYEMNSRFLLVVDRFLEQPAGALRLIENSRSGFKTLNDIQGEPLSIPTESVLAYHEIDDLENCWDVGTLAVRKPYRGRATNNLISTMLYGLLHTAVHEYGIDHLVTILDKHAYSQLTELLGVPFVPMAGSQPFSYLGSENSRAAYLYVPDVDSAVETHVNRFDAEVQKLVRPHVDRLIHGAGLPKIVEVA